MHTCLFDLLADPAITHKSIIKRIVSHHCGRDLTDCIVHQDDTIDSETMRKILADYSDFRDKNKPIEYIVWRCEFLGRKFVVTPATLIPRAETEYMIIAVRDRIHDQYKKNSTDQFCLYDIGTGSGVLGVSVDCETEHRATCVMMTDIDEKCLVVARQNIERLVSKKYQHRFHLQKADLCDFLASSDCVFPKNVQHRLDVTMSNKNTLHHEWDTMTQSKHIHIFVANLPYIPDQAFFGSDELSVREWEPHHAFIGWDDGLDLYRRQLRQRSEWKTINPVRTIMFCEMMTWQAEILVREFPYLVQTVHHTFHANIVILSME